MSNLVEYHNKLEKVLKLLLDPDFHVVSVTYLDLLLTHIKNAVKKEDEKTFKIVQDWIITAVKTWDESVKPNQNIITFSIKLLGAMSANESTLKNLCQKNIHDKICTLFDFHQDSISPSVKMAFTIMLSDLVAHQSGRQWIEQSGAWKVIHKYAEKNHTMYVTKESQKFLSRLLYLECNNTNLCKEIIFAITDPVIKATSDDCKINNQQPIKNKILDIEENDHLVTTLDLLFEILNYTMFIDITNPIPAMIEELTSLKSHVISIFEMSISHTLVKSLHKLYKMLIFSPVRTAVKSSSDISDQTYQEFTKSLYYESMKLISKNCILDFVVSAKHNYIYWKKLSIIAGGIKIPRDYVFEDQAMTLMILPLTAALKPKYMKEHYLFEEFINKLLTVTCMTVQRLTYNVRDLIIRGDFPVEPVCTATVNYMLEVTDVMDRDSAVIMFQVICHVLKNFVTESAQTEKHQTDCEAVKNSDSDNKQPIRKYVLDGDLVKDKQTLLAALLNGLNVLTEKYKLKWQECVETICVLSIAQDILNHSGIETKICILALKTCKLSIQNLMPPNLALLVDFDEYTKEIGPTLFKRLHDPNWEVQDSVLEVLNTIAALSEIKYPPYRGFLLENQFIDIAIEIIKENSESYVRASALTFISTAVRIKKLWEAKLSNLTLPELAIRIVYTESEAIVRREAVVLIKELYIHRKWSPPMLKAMTQAMVAAAVLDLHWEVKINALEFWRHFIKSQLTDQGMLDGHFPTVTFSKEHRKIMSLDEREVKQRLNKALDELARQNCLGVLLVALKDESDLEVSKTSANIISELRQILLENKLDEPLQPSPSLKNTPIFDVNYKRPMENEAKNVSQGNNNHDAVIESIVGANDANLLGAIYRESVRTDNSDETTVKSSGRQTIEYIESVTRSEFLTSIMSFDFETYIKERTEWLENYTISFDSVLEDILVLQDQKNVNSMDCY